VSILVTGGAGSLGRVIQKISQYKTLILDNDEYRIWEGGGILGDVRDKECLRRILLKNHPHTIIHCAALKHVPICEKNPIEAVKTNIIGTINVAEIAKEFEVRALLVSTDKAVEPISVYGATKLIGEAIFLSYGFPVVRMGNFWASRGSVIPLWEKQKAEDKAITITDPDMVRYWITLEQAAKFTLSHIYSKPKVYIPKMSKMSMGELADLIAPDCDHIIIGNRGNEKMEEKLDNL